MFGKVRDFLIGSPIATQQLLHKRLNKIQALAAFAPDALSSIAYANQEIYLALIVAGSLGLALSWPIGLAITGLLILVSTSYLQTIQAYPSGGGSYIVARSNLGTLPGLVAGAALMIDYVLTALIVGLSKFIEGAWITILLIPVDQGRPPVPSTRTWFPASYH